MTSLVDIAVITIFARETLEGGIIIGEYRTTILRSDPGRFPFTKQQGLRAISVSALVAAIVALVLCTAIAVPLAVFSRDFNTASAIIIEGVSKIVAAICILQLSLKMPTFLGLYRKKSALKKQRQQQQQNGIGNSEMEVVDGTPPISDHDDDGNGSGSIKPQLNDGATDEESSPSRDADSDALRDAKINTDDKNDDDNDGGRGCDRNTGEDLPGHGQHGHGQHDGDTLTLRSIQFNVAWNIWREVAECGVFLIPFFLTGDKVISIPVSAVIGVVVGGVVCVAIYIANHRLKSKISLTVFTVLLLVALSAGLFAGGAHKFEMVYGFTPIVYRLRGEFWSVNRLPMTILKPFEYSDVQTALQTSCYFGWLVVSALLYYKKYKQCHIVNDEAVDDAAGNADDDANNNKSNNNNDHHDVDVAASSSFGDGEEEA